MRQAILATAVAVAIAGCIEPPAVREAGTTVTAPPPAPSDPGETVDRLLTALEEADYEAAAGLTRGDQLVLVAMVEGATVDEAVTIIDDGVTGVGAEFWAGFSEGIADFLGRTAGDVAVGEVTTFEAGGQEFARVELRVAGDTADRSLVLARDDGWRVDLIASFPGALAGQLPSVADTIRSHPEPGPLPELARAQVASLEAALTDPQLTPELRQTITSAIVALDR